MNNSDYWKKRFEILEQSAVSKGASYYSSLEKEYREASRRIESEIQLGTHDLQPTMALPFLKQERF